MGIVTEIWPLATIVVIVATLALAQNLAANRRLENWAKESDLQIISSEKRYSRSGPFTGKHWQGQFVYKIHAVDTLGNNKTGWVRVGHWLLGVLADDVDVIWDVSPTP